VSSENREAKSDGIGESKLAGRTDAAGLEALRDNSSVAREWSPRQSPEGPPVSILFPERPIGPATGHAPKRRKTRLSGSFVPMEPGGLEPPTSCMPSKELRRSNIAVCRSFVENWQWGEQRRLPVITGDCRGSRHSWDLSAWRARRPQSFVSGTRVLA
jgi:hypothetical protein